MSDKTNKKYQRDPENNELKHLVDTYRLSRKSVLEIGCGNGILTRQYAQLPRMVIGIDPNLDELKEASLTLPASHSNMFFIPGMGEAMPFPSKTFNLVIFASSL